MHTTPVSCACAGRGEIGTKISDPIISMRASLFIESHTWSYLTVLVMALSKKNGLEVRRTVALKQYL